MSYSCTAVLRTARILISFFIIWVSPIDTNCQEIPFNAYENEYLLVRYTTHESFLVRIIVIQTYQCIVCLSVFQHAVIAVFSSVFVMNKHVHRLSWKC